MQEFIFKIILFFTFCCNLNAQSQKISISIGPTTGLILGKSYINKSEGLAPPSLKTSLYPSAGFMGVNICLSYKKVSLESGLEYTEIGYTFKDHKAKYPLAGSGLGTPVVYIPIRLSYAIKSNKRSNIAPKIGYFYHRREDFSSNESGLQNTVCDYGTDDNKYFLCRVKGISLATISHNLQVGADFNLYLGKTKRHNFYLYPHYNWGLKNLNKTHYTAEVDNKKYDFYIYNRGSFYGIIAGYRYTLKFE
jgi:hypothetical protein